VLQNSAEVIYQIAHCYEKMQDAEQALDWFDRLVSVSPTDPDALAHLGSLFDLDHDKSQAFQYHYVAFRYFPSDIRTVEWLGAYYIESQFPEKAVEYFKRASLVQPGVVKWRLMVASCHRRSGDYPKALAAYKKIHTAFPDNIDCLTFLCRICKDMGMEADLQEYAQLLRKAEKDKESADTREEEKKRKKSGRGSGRRKRGGSGSGSAGGSRTNSGSRRRNRGGSDTGEGEGRGSEGGGGDDGAAAAPPPPGGMPGMDANVGGMSTEDTFYADPMGKMPERPKTAAAVRGASEDDFGDLGDDLLPE